MAVRRARAYSLLLVCAFVLALFPAWAAHAATLTVNSTGDAADANTGDGFCDAVGGGCTLRAAIQQANALPGADTIEFLIDSGPQTISPLSALPTISEAVTLDGTTQPGWVDVPIITVSGASAGTSASGLVVSAGPTTIRGLVVSSFAATGILLQSGTGHALEGNHVGTNSAGNARHANGTGVNVLTASTGNRIGGLDAGDGNLIAGNNNSGLFVSSNGNLIVGNRIGGVGTFTPSNNGNGVVLQSASNNTVGGTSVAARNVISGNVGDGVMINGATATQNTVLGNYIGLSQSGTGVHINGGSGVSITDGSNNTIGGTTAASRNVITGNDDHGVWISGPSATNNRIQGNYIGTNAAGGSTFDASWTRADTGVRIDRASGNIIGGTQAGARNVISLNQTGVQLWGTSGGTQNNRIEGNYIGTDPGGTVDQGNSGPGISLFAAPSNVVGGTESGAGNVVSGNANTNIFVEGTGATGNRIQGNIVGLNAAGTGPLTNAAGDPPNGYGGISVRSANTLVGGTVPAARNIISGHPQHGVEISAPNVLVQGNYIGTSISGTGDFGNDARGVYILSAGGQSPTGTVVGGSSPAARNVIAGNGNGVDLSNSSSGATISGNYIGLDASGSPLGNSTGVSSFAAGANTIGGDALGEGNTISANSTYGIFVGDTSGLTIQGNSIGTNPAGTATAGGSVYGISAGNGTSNLMIGGTTPGAGNVVVGAQVGVSLQGIGSGNVVQGNFIGTDRTGTLDLGNSEDGLRAAMNGTQIGGATSGAGNVIAHNNGAGILLWNSATGMSVRRNSVFDNGTAEAPQLGIDNATSSVRPEPNDPGDGDAGTNLRQNYPVLTGATSTGGSTTVAGTLNSGASTSYAVDLFATPACDVMGNGEGQHYLGSLSTTTDGSGNATFNVPVSGYAPGGWVVTATATDPNGNTSEFSACRTTTGAPAATIDDVSITEGNSGSTNAVFTVSLTAAPGQEASVAYATADGTAVAPGDYAPASGTLIFGPTETSKTISVPVNGDTVSELDEQFTVSLSGPSGFGLLDGTATGTILSDDPPSISVNDINVDEGNSGTTAGAFTLTLSRPVGFAVSVDYDTAHGTAGAGDYTTASGTATFQPGETSVPIDVLVTGDTLDEPDESFTVALSEAIGAGIADSSGTATITDDDAPPSLVISNATVTEGNSGVTNAAFTITASAASAKTITVQVDTADNTATQPADYTAVSTTATIPAGQTSAIVNVPVVGDTADEANQETFHVNLTAPVNATISDAQGVGSINDDDASPTLIVSDETITEGDGGTQVMTFDVTLSAASGREVRVSYNTTGGSATAGSDYNTVSGSLTFNPGETAKTVDVTILGDTLDEGTAETFNFAIGGPTNATVADSTGVGTITDDDTAPTLSVTDNSGPEQNSPLPFTVQLSRSYPQTVTVGYSTANGSAVAGQDYTSASGTLTFAAGTTQQTVNVSILDDQVSEGSETFFVNLATPSGGAVIGDAQGVGTITDAADIPGVSIGDATALEDGGGVVLPITLSRASTTTISVRATTSNDTASAGLDYQAKQQTVTFNPGVTTANFVVVPIDDLRDEFDETFDVTLSNPSANATIVDGAAKGTITDNDSAPSLSVADLNVFETDADTVVNLTVSVNNVSGKAITFDAATSNGSATAPSDYASVAASVTIPAGTVSVQVPVTIKGDDLDEATETFSLTLSNPSNAQLGDAVGEAAIVDDDAAPSLSVQDQSQSEDDASSSVMTFTVSLSGPSGQPVGVDYSAQNGSAVAGGDFSVQAGSLVFQPGQTVKSVDVNIVDDTLDEDDETFALVLSQPDQATLADGTGLGTIIDDDAAPAASIGDAAVTEGNTGTAPATLAVSLAAPSGRTVTVPYSTTASTGETNPAEPDDFTATTGTVTFVPGDTTETLSIPVVGDLRPEPDETFVVALGAPTHAGVGDGVGVVTINDDDAVQVGIADTTAAEGEDTHAVFAVSLNESHGKPVTVQWSTDDTDQNAKEGSDFAADSAGVVEFAAGDTSETISVPLVDDNVEERTESFLVRLSQPINAVIQDGEASGAISDEADTPTMTAGDVTVAEDVEAGVATVTVTLNRATAYGASADFSVAAGTATAPHDYTTTSGMLQVPAGQTTGSITVPLVDDANYETDETFTVQLSNPTHALIEDDYATVTVDDDDGPPTASIGNVSVTENDSGQTVSATFLVSLSASSYQPISLGFATAAGTAAAGQDFTARNGTINFPAGTTTRTLTIQVPGDLLDENNEYFDVTLNTPVNTSIVDGSGRGTILDDDPVPLITIANRTVTEGNTASKLSDFTVRLNRPSGRTLTVLWRTVEGTADAPSDYEAKSGKLTFTPGQVQKTINVKVFGDTRREPDEAYKVVLSSPVNAAFGDNTAVGRILNND